MHWDRGHFIHWVWHALVLLVYECNVSHVLGVLWNALALEFPLSRRAHGGRFLYEGRPLSATMRASTLRAMARSFIEAKYCAVARSDRRNPVEIIAAALDLSTSTIEGWKRNLSSHDGFVVGAVDLACRVVAFEQLYALQTLPVWNQLREELSCSLVRILGPEQVTELWARYREAAALAAFTLTASSKHREAMLAEVIVAGSSSATVRPALLQLGIHFSVKEATTAKRTIPFARAIALSCAGDAHGALGVLEEIIRRVPGHVLALEQAARCCSALRLLDASRTYSSRASRVGPRRQHSFVHRQFVR